MIHSHEYRIYSRAQSDVLVFLSIKVYYSPKLNVKLRSYRNGYWGRLRHLSSLTRYLALYDYPPLASCNPHPCRCCETTSSRGFACLWTGGFVLPFQRGTNGRSFSQTGSSPERHQSPISWTRDQSHQPARTCGKLEAYNGVFDSLMSQSPLLNHSLDLPWHVFSFCLYQRVAVGEIFIRSSRRVFNSFLQVRQCIHSWTFCALSHFH